MCKDPGSFLADGPGYREKSCGKCGIINRDINAAANLKEVWDWWLRCRSRPAYLSPVQDGKSPQPKARGGAHKPSASKGTARGQGGKSKGGQGPVAAPLATPPSKRQRVDDAAADSEGSSSDSGAGV